MAIRKVPGTDLSYHLINFDKRGSECADDPDAPGGVASELVRRALRDEPITDVFFVSHGWKGDIPAAIEQCDKWIGAVARCPDDRAKVVAARPGFRSLIVGLHWPSLPWGVEDPTAGAGTAFDAAGDDPWADFIDAAAGAIADTDRAREALAILVEIAGDDMEPPELPPAAVDAYRMLVQEAGLEARGPAAAPGDDAEGFDPVKAYRAARTGDAMVGFGGGGIGGALLSPLRQVSFWTMKKRARTFGEGGAAALLRQLQRDVPAGRDVQFHLMGHSFGCIVVSGAIAGSGGNAPLPKPVSSAFLVQGALSFWSYCSDVPASPGHAGYFHSIPRDGKISGPLLTTQSEHDTAVGQLYPLAAGLARQVDYAPGELPKYGALGTFGLRGPGLDIVDLQMKPLAASYDFSARKIYNLESSAVISEGGGFSGAHSDIAKPEVAHAFWSAVLAASKR